MCTFTLLAFSVLLFERVLALSIDQRQTGDLNVQIDLKNFKLFALTKGKEEYVDYDYAYDYSEMTIKPQNGTTSTTIKPLNITETAVQINKDNTTVAPVHQLTTQITENASITTDVASTEPIDAIAVASTTPVTVATAILRHNTLNSTIAENNNATAHSDCKKGFFRDNIGNCQLKLQNPSNILLKMLQQKSKSSGRNGVRKS